MTPTDTIEEIHIIIRVWSCQFEPDSVLLVLDTHFANHKSVFNLVYEIQMIQNK